jgi:hypothetical protein
MKKGLEKGIAALRGRVEKISQRETQLQAGKHQGEAGIANQAKGFWFIVVESCLIGIWE